LAVIGDRSSTATEKKNQNAGGQLHVGGDGNETVKTLPPSSPS